ncbi:MAG: acyltransferase [Pseudomonadota bacterium]
MFHFLPSALKGCISLLLYIANTLFWVPLLLILSLLKFIIQLKSLIVFFNLLINGIALSWISVNNFCQQIVNNTRYHIEGVDDLKADNWYLVVCNHQSWADILVLQRIFHRKIPFLKFFLKKELLWVPLLGLAWWALDFPFMKRYPSEFVKKNPQFKGKDIEITRKACEKFKAIPVSIMNFVEGTRFTPEKHRRQNSPYRHLLKPKSGGIGFVLSAMGEKLNTLLDVTIIYPRRCPTFWDFMCGKIQEINVRVKAIPINEMLIGDYSGDAEFRAGFQAWVNTLWEEKDRTMTAFPL